MACGERTARPVRMVMALRWHAGLNDDLLQGEDDARPWASPTPCPTCREAGAERFSALIKALTGRKPGVYRRSDGRIRIKCYEGYLEGFMCYTELAEAIAKWLEETGRR